ncbi:C-factor-like protein [Aphelenchoides besseyi]|nr:C-factor-like protein [Aphelenchoides besseyi]KAI6224581.1 C-factor-like protein [Aphelenchoides besseyi]
MSYLGESVLITGANRGIGLALVEYIIKDYPEVKKLFAATRSPANSKELNALASKHKQIHVIQLDVSSDISIKKAAEVVEKEVGNSGLGLLINNAGIMTNEGNKPSNPDRESVLNVFNVNLLGTTNTTATFLPLLQKAAKATGRSAKVLNISTPLASRKINATGMFNFDFAYCSSKVALNMYTHVLALTPEAQNIIALAMSPGWVQTDMGGASAPLTTDDAIPPILKTTASATKELSGKFIHFDGNELTI